MKIFRISFLAALLGAFAGLLPLRAQEILFDAQAYDVISGSGTTAPGAVPWNGLDTAPPAFNAFFLIDSASVTNGEISVSMTGLLGTWTGNSAFIVSQRPLENDYFVIAPGATASMTVSGLIPGARYYTLFYHGRAEPGQLRTLTLYFDGQRIGGMDNQSAGGGGNTVGAFLVADESGQLVVDMTAGGAEGDFAGFTIELNELPPETWAGYTLVDGTLVDTTPLLGWLYVADAPWLYSYSLNRYIYADEQAFASGGAWIYVPR